MKKFKMGQSNPTFLLIDANGKKCVVRKKPPGGMVHLKYTSCLILLALISKTAHLIEREYRVLKALKDSLVPVPFVYFFNSDPSLLGTSFYVMEFLDGRIFADNLLPTVKYKREYYYQIIKTLVALHSVDFKKIGLEGFGKEGGYYSRQISSLSSISVKQAKETGQDGTQVGELYEFGELTDWLKSNIVEDQISLVHGDFKTDNIVFDKDPNSSQVIGLLDWELSTIGHPLSDLANLLLPWYIPGQNGISGFWGVARPIPVPEANDLIREYCRLCNRPYPIKNWKFCIVFAFFRLAVIMQGIAARVKRNQASSGFANKIASLFLPTSMMAYSIAFNDEFESESEAQGKL